MAISYKHVSVFPGWEMAQEYFRSLIQSHSFSSILEVGSGANPTLDPKFVQEQALSYTTSDLDADELQKADPIFKKLQLDLSSESLPPSLVAHYDLVFSRMVGEHVSNGRQFHTNIYRMLRPGGFSVHCFSTLWALPFAINRLLPDRITNFLLNTFAPRELDRHGKFAAYYSWSRGPSKKMMQRFEALGFEIVSYQGYFGHDYYRRTLPWLHTLEKRKTQFLLQHPIPELCSYALVILRKPI